jgi:hypothetical protein
MAQFVLAIVGTIVGGLILLNIEYGTFVPRTIDNASKSEHRALELNARSRPKRKPLPLRLVSMRNASNERTGLARQRFKSRTLRLSRKRLRGHGALRRMRAALNRKKLCATVVARQKWIAANSRITSTTTASLTVAAIPATTGIVPTLAAWRLAAPACSALLTLFPFDQGVADLLEVDL